jgi:redox-sensitive bicupin YhaK (pirin superfamily)
MSGLKARSIAKQFLAIEQSEGVGARVRRSIGTMNARNFSPFLMLDHFSVKNGGFPDHPHRGQETITYVLQGNIDHEDFTGSKGTIGPGDLQFMTAGRGIVHAEMPRTSNTGEYPVGMQLWVDLPKELKACEPRYRDVRAKEIPIAKPDDKVTVKVISGRLHGVDSIRDLAYTPVWFFDYDMKPGAKAVQEMPKDFNAFVYVLEGSLKIGSASVPQYSCVLFKTDGDAVEIEVPQDAKQDTRFILVGGQILDQPVVQHGPFVETSRDKIMQAFIDYQTHSNGFERAADWESEIGKRPL